MSTKHVKQIMETISADIGATGLNKRSEIAAVTLGTESMDASAQDSATSQRGTLLDTVEATVQTILSTEDFSGMDITEAQMKAAKYIAPLAIDPQSAVGSLTSLKQIDAPAGSVNVSAEDMGIEDIVDPLTIGNEAYDGQSINNALYYSITYNLLASRQDAFGEGFFPTITIDPTSSGANIESEYISLYNEITRTKDGAPDAGKFEKIPVVKAIYDNDLFASDRNKIVPVSRAENADVLVPALAFVDKSTGSEITTAPIKFGKNISLLGISQTDAQLTKGSMDNTDALANHLVVENVYYSLEGDDGAGGTTTENFKFSAAILPFSNFTYTTQDHNKDMGLSFQSDSIYIKTGSTLTADGSASTTLAALPQNHTIGLKVVLNGSANAQAGDIVIYANQIEVVEVRDAAGNVLPSTNADYVAIATAFSGKVNLVGYTVEAYTTNSNLRTRGQMITSDRYNQIYTVPLRQGITVVTPTKNATGNDNDASKINNQITYAGIRTSIHAVQTLTEYAKMLKNITANGAIENVKVMGVARHHVSPYYAEENIDVTTFVDSIKSTDRLGDIQAVLVNNIKEAVINMSIDSNYSVANTVLRGAAGGKISVIIGTDPKIAHYLTRGDETIDIGDDYEAKVVSTPNKAVAGKIFVTFVVNENRNTEPHPLNFGQMFWAPTITTDVVRTMNGSTSRELSTMPRFLHVVNLPILSVFNVSNIAAALGKVTKNFHTV